MCLNNQKGYRRVRVIRLIPASLWTTFLRKMVSSSYLMSPEMNPANFRWSSPLAANFVFNSMTRSQIVVPALGPPWRVTASTTRQTEVSIRPNDVITSVNYQIKQSWCMKLKPFLVISWDFKPGFNPSSIIAWSAGQSSWNKIYLAELPVPES